MKVSRMLSLGSYILTLGCWMGTALRVEDQNFVLGNYANRFWVAVPGKEATVLKEYETNQSARENEFKCFDNLCDKMLQHAHQLSRLKLIRRYVRDTLSTLDRFVTAMDVELIASGEYLQRAFGSSCPAAKEVLNDVTSASADTIETR